MVEKIIFMLSWDKGISTSQGSQPNFVDTFWSIPMNTRLQLIRFLFLIPLQVELNSIRQSQEEFWQDQKGKQKYPPSKYNEIRFHDTLISTVLLRIYHWSHATDMLYTKDQLYIFI